MNPDQLQLEIQEQLLAGQNRLALQRASDLVQIQPGSPFHWSLLGKVLLTVKEPEQAAFALQRACELDPENVDHRTTLGGVYQSLGAVEEAIHWHGEALALDPHSLALGLNHAFIWPSVAESTSQIDACRARCREAFDRLLADPLLYLHPKHGATLHTFEMAYHGLDDRRWLQEYADLLLHHLKPQKPDVFSSLQRRPQLGSRRLRLGFLSSFFGNHSNTQAFAGLIEAIDRQRFTLVLIHANAKPDNPEHVRMNQLADQVVRVATDIPLARKQLMALKLDLLFFTDVGMDPSLPPLLVQRSAPVQVSGWGFPRTTGFSTIDHYLSGDMVEPAHAQDHYSENLIRLRGLPCRFLSSELEVDPEAAALGRDYFLLPPDQPLVGVLQHIVKIHPDLDEVLECIAKAIPEVVFVLVPRVNLSVLERFLLRLKRTAPMASERIMPLLSMNLNQFSTLAGCLDLQLDTPHFGSGITFYQTIHTGTPILTTEGPYLRSRFVSGGYKLMGLEDPPVTADMQGMADLAISLLKDPVRLKSLRERIKASSHLLYDRMDVVHSFEDFAIEAVAKAEKL